MDLIPIACAGKKRRGGRSIYRESVALKESLPPGLYQRLLNARKEQARIFRQPPNTRIACLFGEDLGDDRNAAGVTYLAAYDRYDGVVYRKGENRQGYPAQRSMRLAIISALYGLLDADD
jgi:hypothetical protein